MKVGLIACISIDGIISKDGEDNLEWRSGRDRKIFSEISHRYDVMIMGDTTYKTMPEKVFEDGRKWIVLTENESGLNKRDNVHFLKGTPEEIMKEAEKLGYKSVLIIGGGFVFNQYLTTGLIENLYLVIAPKIFYKGMKLFNADTQVDFSYTLSETRILNTSEIMLHYKRVD